MSRVFWTFVDQNLSRGIKVGLLLVVESTPGSPGRTGFKMALTQSGEMSGTVGGGIMEMQLLNKMKSMLSTSECVAERGPILVPQVHQKNSTRSSGLICSGAQTVLLMVLDETECHGVRQLSGWSTDHDELRVLISESGFEVSGDKGAMDYFNFEYRNSHSWQWSERHGPESRCYIIGGGHVGLSLSRLLSVLDTHITVFDHRNDLDQIKQNQYADKIVLGPYREIFKYVKEGMDSYVFVVSTSFKTDEEALSGMLSLNLGYLGLMASKTKKAKIFQNLRDQGFANKILEKVRCPIGIPIASRTTDEIAVSIVAEMIQIKNSRCNDQNELIVRNV